jgi:hypothetical protein
VFAGAKCPVLISTSNIGASSRDWLQAQQTASFASNLAHIMASKPMKMPTSHGHTAGIYADMSVDGPRIGTLVVIFDRAKNLPNRKTMGKQNPYVAARLGKEAKKTETDMRGGQTPRW